MRTEDGTQLRNSAKAVGEVVIIAAVARNGVAGAGNGMPWDIPEDLRHFRLLTTGHATIMGRLTFEAIGHPLPHRQNIVLSRGNKLLSSGVETASTMSEALRMVKLPSPVFVIGGRRPWCEALPIAHCLILTEIQQDFFGDVRFPDFDRADWSVVSSRRGVGDSPRYDFLEYRRRSCIETREEQ